MKSLNDKLVDSLITVREYVSSDLNVINSLSRYNEETETREKNVLYDLRSTFVRER